MLETDPRETLVYRLRKRSEIRLSIQSRKSIQQGEPDRISELLLEAADELENQQKVIEKNNLEIYELNKVIGEMDDIIDRQEETLRRIYHYGHYPENE